MLRSFERMGGSNIYCRTPRWEVGNSDSRQDEEDARWKETESKEDARQGGDV
jgi:hypothetical protein